MKAGDKPELFMSVDIETNGRIPGPSSMLSFGAAAFTVDKKMLGTFTANLETLPGAEGEKSTMEWWATQPEAWAACRKDLQDPKVAMTNFVEWVESFKNYSPVFVGYPAGFDFTFMHWYSENFVGRDPFSFSALDIKSFAMAVLKTDFRKATKSNFPGRWFPPGKPHTHVAIEDAIEQGLLFLNILEDSRK
jgi:hypothetical protein